MYMENGVAKPFPSICGYEGTLAYAPEPLPVTYPSSSHPSSSSGRQPSRKLSKTTRERISAGPSRVLPSGAGQSKWEEPNLPDVPKLHSLFVTAWQEADMNLQRIKSGVVDPGYHFQKPMLFVNVSMLEKKKTYLLNWLSACQYLPAIKVPIPPDVEGFPQYH
ncbi:hypothetical protein EDC04DRAFT_2608196 [Pisolithus marmoratus]|nr:hypothetical protein EDC04DRAFT_2608196 [Pisolithus marmoratus]